MNDFFTVLSFFLADEQFDGAPDEEETEEEEQE